MKIEQITFTRFLAAFSIVVYHYGETVSPFNNKHISFLFRHADVSVSYFFLLSGFIMIVAYRNKESINSLQYYKTRIARIYPSYLLALFLILIHEIYKKSLSIRNLALSFFAIQAWVPGKVMILNYPAWSLSVEFFFYAIFPLLFNRFYATKKKIAIPVLLIWLSSNIFANWFVNSNYYHPFPSKTYDFVNFFPLVHINAFLVGNLLGLYFLENLGRQRNYDLLIVLFAILFLVLLKYSMNIYYHDGLMAIVFAPLIFFISSSTGVITKIFRSGILVFLGETSYGIYILQAPVFMSSRFVLKFFGITNETPIFYVTVPLLIAAASLSYLFIEKPLRDWAKNTDFTQVKYKLLNKLL